LVPLATATARGGKHSQASIARRPFLRSAAATTRAAANATSTALEVSLKASLTGAIAAAGR
jgi:hypothetical protein